jgi:hypothetical protein
MLLAPASSSPSPPRLAAEKVDSSVNQGLCPRPTCRCTVFARSTSEQWIRIPGARQFEFRVDAYEIDSWDAENVSVSPFRTNIGLLVGVKTYAYTPEQLQRTEELRREYREMGLSLDHTHMQNIIGRGDADTVVAVYDGYTTDEEADQDAPDAGVEARRGRDIQLGSRLAQRCRAASHRQRVLPGLPGSP